MVLVHNRGMACGLIAVWAALAAPLAAAGADRRDRTASALDDLVRVCRAAEQRGESVLTHQVAIFVGRQALLDLDDAPENKRARILDHVYLSCLRAKVAVLQASVDKRRLPLPPAPRTDAVTLKGAEFRKGGRLAVPIAAHHAPANARDFFARGEFARFVPALAGATAETVANTEVFRIHSGDPTSRRVGWDRPAGGFVCGPAQGRPPILIAIDHPGIREAIARETAKAIYTQKESTPPLYHTLGAQCFYTDYSPLAATRFADWLTQRYKTIRTLNAVWDTEFARFAADLMPTPDQAVASPPRWWDWAEFNQHRLTEHLRWACDNVRRDAPAARIGLATVRYALAGAHGLSGVDPLALTDVLDVVELDGADALQADLAAAIAGSKRPVVERALGPGPFGILPHILHGNAAVQLAKWPPTPLTGLTAVLDAQRALREAVDIRRVGDTATAIARGPKPLALLYSRASMLQSPPWALRADATPYSRTLAAAYQAARFLDAGITFLTSPRAEASRWGKARVIIVAGSPAEHDPVARALIDFVELGGQLVILPESLVTDERGREADYLLRMGIEVAGTTRPTYTTAPPPDGVDAPDRLTATNLPRAAVLPRGDGPAASARRPLRGLGIRQKIEVNVVHQALATFADGSDAIVTFERGKGSITYFAMPLEPEDMALVLRSVLARAGVRPLVRLTDPDFGTWGLECRSVRHQEHLLAYVWNTTPERRRVSLQVRAASSATDLRTAARLPLRKAPAGPLIGPLRIGPFETIIVEIAD